MRMPDSKRTKIHNLQLTTGGFTLIELLVVMSIIAILALVSLFALRGVRESARDTARKSDLQQLASGFEIYKSDCKFYPNLKPTPPNPLTGVPPCNPVNGNTYIQVVPDDVDTNKNYMYVPYNPSLATPTSCPTTSNCTNFRLWALLENPETLPTYCTGAPSCGSAACNYCITNP